MKITLTLTDGAFYKCAVPTCGEQHHSLDIHMRDAETGERFPYPVKHQDLTRAQAFGLIVMKNFDILAEMADSLVLDGVAINISDIISELEVLQSSPTASRQQTH